QPVAAPKRCSRASKHSRARAKRVTPTARARARGFWRASPTRPESPTRPRAGSASRAADSGLFAFELGPSFAQNLGDRFVERFRYLRPDFELLECPRDRDVAD